MLGVEACVMVVNVETDIPKLDVFCRALDPKELVVERTLEVESCAEPLKVDLC